MKKSKKLAIILAVVMMFSSCQNKTNKVSDETQTAQTKEVKKEDNKFTDDAGREVTLPENISKIAPSGGLAQQVLLSIAPDKIVAISFAPKDEMSKKILSKIAELPEIGQFYGKGDFNAESLAQADPDVVIDVGEPKDTISEDMDTVTSKSGKPAIFINMSFDNAAESYRKLGEVLHEEEKAEKLANYVDRVNKEVKENMEKVGDKKLIFVYLTGENGLGSNPKGSFHMQMLDLFGENAFVSEEKSTKGGGNEISQEELLKLNPDVIIFGPGSVYDDVENNPVFSNLKAIQEGKYVEAPSIPFNWIGFPPSVNRFMGAQWVGKLFYPEQFDYDLKERIKEYFELFYGYELSDEEYDKITEKAFFKK